MPNQKQVKTFIIIGLQRRLAAVFTAWQKKPGGVNRRASKSIWML
jgi:hypothetical protein